MSSKRKASLALSTNSRSSKGEGEDLESPSSSQYPKNPAFARAFLETFWKSWSSARRGLLGEARIMQHALINPYFVRCSEFAPLDGLLICDPRFAGFDILATDSQRLKILRELPFSPNALAYIEAKTVSLRLLVRQNRRHSSKRLCPAFRYVPLTKAQASSATAVLVHPPASNYIALIPAFIYTAIFHRIVDDNSDIIHWSQVPPRAVQYFFPLTMLSEALSRLRSAALGGGDYTVPVSQVCIAGWRPQLLDRKLAIDWLDVLRHPRTASGEKSKALFSHAVAQSKFGRTVANLDTAPLIADIVLIVPRLTHLATGASGPRELTFELKVVTDFTEELVEDRLSFRLHDSAGMRCPFHPLRRWDFILLHTLQRQEGNYGFCLPRSRIPTSWMERGSLLQTEYINLPFSVALSVLRPYRVDLAVSNWIDRFYTDHIVGYEGLPPIELDQLKTSNIRLSTLDEKISRECLHIRARHNSNTSEIADPTIVETCRAPAPSAEGRRAEELAFIYSRPRLKLHSFIRRLQDECARRGYSIILPLRGHAVGDYIFVAFRWSHAEQYAWFEQSQLPIDFNHPSLNPSTTACVILLTRPFQYTARGPLLYNVPAPRSRSKTTSTSKRLCGPAGVEYFDRPLPYIFIGEWSFVNQGDSTGVCLAIPSTCLDFALLTKERASGALLLQRALVDAGSANRYFLSVENLWTRLVDIYRRSDVTFSAERRALRSHTLRCSIHQVFQQEVNANIQFAQSDRS